MVARLEAIQQRLEGIENALMAATERGVARRVVQRATAAGGPWTTIVTVNRAAPAMNTNGSINDAG
jgi:hypothetical protein